MEIKQMEYQERMTTPIVLAKGTYKKYEYAVLSLGTHPCAYIIINNTNKLFGLDYDTINEKYPINCHCGLTYSEEYLNFLEFSEKYHAMVKSSITDKWVIGWDYAHYMDYCGWDTDNILNGKKWTTHELIQDCKELIEDIIKINEDDLK